MEIEVKNVDVSGSGYAVVYADDGSSFGLQFRGLPVEDDALFEAALTEQVNAVITRMTPPPTKVMDPKILERVGVKKAKGPK